MASLLAAHEPNPYHHVMDDHFWPFFDRLFGDPIEIPLGPISKFMILELFAAGLILAIYIPIARKAAQGDLPKGRWWNCFEYLLTFVRNEIAIPNLGKRDADKFVPFLWTMFLFILFCNLLGMIPFMGSPTASIWATGGLALCSFVMMYAPGIAAKGPIGFFKSLWPHIDVPYVGVLFSTMIFVIELIGTGIKSGVLAVRLFANMFAGHMVLAMLLLFIYSVGKLGYNHLWPLVTFSSVVGVVALSFLEIFVAFLQAYIFVFLTALFMGMTLHPQH